MATNVARMDPALILQPAQPSMYGRLTPSPFGANLTLAKGQSLGRKTSDGKMYAFNPLATDGTNTWAGFNAQSLGTDASGNVFYVAGTTTAQWNVWVPQSLYGSFWTGGIFIPNDVFTASPTGTLTAEVDTLTPAGTITAADNFVIAVPSTGVGPDTEVNFVAVAGSVTPTNIVTGLKTAWAANPIANALATATGTATLILTAKTSSVPMNLTAYCEGVGTLTLVITTPAVSAQTAEVDTWTLTTAPSTGDVFTMTITYPGLSTAAVTFTVGATQTVAAVTAGLAAAWNANNTGTYPSTGASAYAVATSTATTVVLTSANAGSAMNVAMITTSASTTIAKAITTPALGRNIADIQANGRPGAYQDQATGFWIIP